MPFKTPEAYQEWKREYLKRSEVRTRNREYQREYRRRGKRKPPTKEQEKEWRERRRERTAKARQIIHAAKDRPCVDCGQQLPSDRMHFDHVRGEKLFCVSGGEDRSPKAIEAEIAKCEIRCNVCHSRRHAIERWAQVPETR